MLRLIFVAVLLATPAIGETIMQCGGSKGWAYYFAGPSTGEPDMGWVEDGISAGGVALTREGDILDLLIKDSIGLVSVTGEGATVSLIDAYGDYITVLVSYPQGSKELYTFDVGRRKLSWSQHRFGFATDKVQTFLADCQ